MHYAQLSGYASFAYCIHGNIRHENLHLLCHWRIANPHWIAKIQKHNEIQPAVNSLRAMVFQIQVQSTKKESKPDFAILQSQSWWCLQQTSERFIALGQYSGATSQYRGRRGQLTPKCLKRPDLRATISCFRWCWGSSRCRAFQLGHDPVVNTVEDLHIWAVFIFEKGPYWRMSKACSGCWKLS